MSNWFLRHDSELTVLLWPPQSPGPNLIKHLWYVVEQLTTYVCTGDKSAATVWSCQNAPKSQRNVQNTLLNRCHKESKQCWRQKGVQLLTSFNYWSGWWVYFCKFISDICFWKTYVTTMDLFETDRDKERKKGERLGTLYSGLDPWSNDANIWLVASPTSVLGRRVRPTVEPQFQEEQCRFCCKYETVGHVIFLTKVL